MAADSTLVSTLSDTLHRFDGVVSADLFGSLAEGRAHRHSDVDLGVLLS